MRKVVCDRCGKEAQISSATSWDVTVQVADIEPIYVDLCDNCVNRLTRWLKEKDPISVSG